MKFRHAAAAITAMLVMNIAAAQTAAPAKPATTPAPATTAAKPGANPAADPATPGMPKAETATVAPAAPGADATVAVKPGDATAGQGKAAACGACHGMDGNSTDAQYPKLANQNEQYIVTQLMRFKTGVRQNAIMQGMASTLSPQDMHDIGAYFAQQKRLPGVADEKLANAGEKIYREGDSSRGIPACMACHGPDGTGNPGWRVPNVGGQHADYVQTQLKAWHDGASWGSDTHAQIMPAIAQHLTEQDISAVSSYIEGLHAAPEAKATSKPNAID